MTNFELIEDYLAGKLGESEKAAFEQQLTSDPSLKAEVDMQRQIIEGVRQARVAELKAMLNQVPIPGSVSFTQWIGGIAAVAVVGAAVVWYMRADVGPDLHEELAPQTETVAPAPESPNDSPEVTPESTEPVKEQVEAKQEKTETVKPKVTEPNPVVQPKLDVMDPSSELTTDTQPGEEPVQSVSGHNNTQPLEVKVVSNSRYDNHYQRDQGTLILYGDFDKTLYEIIEVQDEEHLAFLYHQNRYYKLDGGSNAIQKLIAITDPQLISKLRELRKK
ncbi:MAG: anti-sigma factor family protein [Cyclobacteriaceae bacterium]|jgi:hypothetical protein